MRKNRSNENTEVLWNKEVAPLYFNMGLAGNDKYSVATPGQFVMLHSGSRLSALLRRPFSIHRLNRNNDGSVQSIEILYKVVGKSTRLFSELREGSRIELLGPLGKGFDVSQKYKRIFLAGGGIGIAPMIFLAMMIKQRGIDCSEYMCFIGGRSKDDILCTDDFEGAGILSRISTDDGSAGEKGLITDLLVQAINEKKPDIIYACGPHPMLKAVSLLAQKNDIRCQLSIETMMACGMGACLGCAVEGTEHSGKYKHACVDGPVFNAEDILL